MEKLVTIDDRLIADALHMSGLIREEDVIQLSLKMFTKIRLKKQEIVKRYMGTMEWSADQWGDGREDIRAII